VAALTRQTLKATDFSGPAAPPDAANDSAACFVTRTPAGLNRLELSVPGIHCGSCIRAVETTLSALPGVETARVNLGTRKVAVLWRGDALNGAAIVDALDRSGFPATPFDTRADDAAGDAEGRFLFRCLGVAGFAAGNVMLFSVAVWAGLGGEMGLGTRTVFHLLSAFVAVPATLYAGLPFYRSAWRALRGGRANMDVPISIAVLLALALSLYQTAIGAEFAYFDASVTLLFFLLIGRALDHWLRNRARGAAQALLGLQSATARLITPSGHAAQVPVRDIVPGDRIQLMPGERVPVDSTVESGTSEIDVSLVSGESVPTRVASGSPLGAGALNLGAPLVILARARVEDSLVAELARIVEAGEQSRSRYVRLADKAARLYVPVVHTTALAVFAGWWAIGGELAPAVHNAIATLIITCPCALGLAVPVTQVVAVGRLLRAGMLVKSGDALERLAEADAVVLDKTGTLTAGRPALIRDDASTASLNDAARLARLSRHPLARALAQEAGPGEIASQASEVPGFGIEATIDGQTWRLGRSDWAGNDQATGDELTLELWFRKGDAAPVRFAFEDRLRPDVHELIAGLRARGLQLHMLSGDRDSVAAALAKDLGLETWQAHTTPAGKVAYLEALARSGRKVLMIGDGLNDAPALAAAHVSIAPASASDASQAASDMVICGERLGPVLTAIDVSHQSRTRILEGFAFAAIYNCFAIPFAAAGLVTPLISAIAMSASSIIVMLNALRLMGPRS
jgi:Cu2+-exporting ATPase